jgi:hypothetical protein
MASRNTAHRSTIHRRGEQIHLYTATIALLMEALHANMHLTKLVGYESNP